MAEVPAPLPVSFGEADFERLSQEATGECAAEPGSRDWRKAPHVMIGVVALIAGAVSLIGLLILGVGVLSWALGAGQVRADLLSANLVLMGGVCAPWSMYVSSVLSGVGIATSVLVFAAVLTREAWVSAADVGGWILRRKEGACAGTRRLGQPLLGE
jgi:hypothetical protein